MKRHRWLLVWVIAWSLAGSARAGEASGTVQSTRLYTKPDPAAAGGIRGSVATPAGAMVAIFALPPADTSRVYKGEVLAGQRAFEFKGLPVGKYDLVVLYEDGFYEGLTLTRGLDELTSRDRELIEAIVQRQVPFFDTKKIHRCAGGTGAEAKARAVLQELRTGKILAQSAEELKGYQIRSLKLVWLEDVGTIGWQFVNSREIVRQEVAPSARHGLLQHHFSPRLSGVRVTDAMKDLGALNLDATTNAPEMK